MINILDLIVGGLILFYLLKNAGGVLRTIKNLLFALIMLLAFGIAARLIVDSSLPNNIRQPLEKSYLVGLSHAIIKVAYPALEGSAPKVDSFMKEKILSAPGNKMEVPKLKLPEKFDPQAKLKELLKEER